MSAVFTEQDAERIRAAFDSFKSNIFDIRNTLERVEPQGKFMNIFIARNEENVSILNSSFSTFAMLDVVLVKALSARGWKLVQALVLREEGDVLRFRVRIEKNKIKQNNER